MNTLAREIELATKTYGDPATIIADSKSVGKVFVGISITRNLEALESTYGFSGDSARIKHIMGIAHYVSIAHTEALMVGSMRDGEGHVTEDMIEDFCIRDASCYNLKLVELVIREEHAVQNVYARENDPADCKALLATDPDGVVYHHQYPKHDGSGNGFDRFSRVIENTDEAVDAALRGDEPIEVFHVGNLMRHLQDVLLSYGSTENVGRHRYDTQGSRLIESRLERVAQLVLDSGYGFRYVPVFPQYRSGAEGRNKVSDRCFRSARLSTYRVFPLKNDSEVI